MEKIKKFINNTHKIINLFVLLLVASLTLAISSFQSGNQVYRKLKQSKAAEAGKSYYVSITGNDNNNGSETSPWKTIKKATNIVSAGDTIYVKEGTYGEILLIENKRGSLDMPITIKNYQNEKPVFDGNYSFDTGEIKNSSFIVIDGLTFTRSQTLGVETTDSTNITFKNCEVSYSRDGGLVSRHSSNILIDNCNVHHTNQAMIGVGGEKREASHEVVSFGDVDGFEIKNSQVHDSEEEGIDTKQGSKNGKIHHNIVYSNVGPNLYLGGGSNVEIYNNVISDVRGSDKSNIGLAVEEGSGNTYDFYIYNNILKGGYSGLSFWIEEGSVDPSIERIKVYNNLFYGIGDRGALKFRGNQEIVSKYRDLDFKNNIFWKNNINILKDKTVTLEFSASNNLFDKNQFGTDYILTSNAGFVDENNRNFQILKTSNAVDKGVTTSYAFDFDGITRPQGESFDIGPYEYNEGNIININPTIVNVTSTPIPTLTSVPTVTRVPTNTPTSTPRPTFTPYPTVTGVVSSSIRRESFNTRTIRGNYAGSFSTSLLIDGGQDRLYLTTISTKPYVKDLVSSVDGLGLTWKKIKLQCSGRSQTSIEVWAAYGSVMPPSDYINVNFSNSRNLKSVAIAVASYSGAADISRLTNITSRNTLSMNDQLCTGGIDSTNYSAALTNQFQSSVIFGAVSLRKNSHTPSSGFAEIVEVKSGNESDDAGVALVERYVSAIGTQTISGSISQSTDYAFVGLEIPPR